MKSNLQKSETQGSNLQKANGLKAQEILQKLYISGVRDFVVCPGGRNAPFVELFDKCIDRDITLHWGFEERSAAFFALGLSMKENKPVAVFTTSGTAFVETASALLEAHYSGLPLIVVSSDRPEKQWGTGAPQTLIQKDFLISHLGPSVDESYDIKSVSYPLHINCTFEEPLIDKKMEPWDFKNLAGLTTRDAKKFNPYKYSYAEYSLEKLNHFLQENEILSLKRLKQNLKLKMLLVVTNVPQSFKELLKINQNFIESLNLDIYFESTGEVSTFKTQLNSRYIDQLDILSYDLVIRLGGIPTHRFWRDIEVKNYKKVFNFSQLPLPGLSFGDIYSLDNFFNFVEDLKSLLLKHSIELQQSDFEKEMSSSFSSENLKENFSVVQNSTKIFSDKSTQNESNEKKLFSVLKQMARDLDKNNSQDATVFYIGNSLPIRYWDLDKSLKFDNVYASRGLNGIDGQLSTAIGLATKYEKQKTICVLGDLTTMYDLAAPWYWVKNKDKMNFSLLVINNSGGQIFSKMFQSSYFINKHDLDFKHWAAMWNLTYDVVESSEELLKKYSHLEQWPDILEYKTKSNELFNKQKDLKD